MAQVRVRLVEEGAAPAFCHAAREVRFEFDCSHSTRCSCCSHGSRGCCCNADMHAGVESMPQRDHSRPCNCKRVISTSTRLHRLQHQQRTFLSIREKLRLACIVPRRAAGAAGASSCATNAAQNLQIVAACPAPPPSSPPSFTPPPCLSRHASHSSRR